MLTRIRVAKVKLEAVKGTKLSGDTAIYLEDLEVSEPGTFIDRAGTGKYLGTTEPGVIGERAGRIAGTAELRNTSTGLETALGILLQGCGLKKATETYQVHSSVADQKTASIDVWQDGIRYGLAGSMGNYELRISSGERITFAFDMQGVWQTPADEAVPAFAPETTSPVIASEVSLSLGGDAKDFGEFVLRSGNVFAPRGAAGVGGIGYYVITDQRPIVEMNPNLELVADEDYWGSWLAGTEIAGIVAVTQNSRTYTINMPAMQIQQCRPGDRDGIATAEITAQLNHDSGNDALNLVVT